MVWIYLSNKSMEKKLNSYTDSIFACSVVKYRFSEIKFETNFKIDIYTLSIITNFMKILLNEAVQGLNNFNLQILHMSSQLVSGKLEILRSR